MSTRKDDDDTGFDTTSELRRYPDAASGTAYDEHRYSPSRKAFPWWIAAAIVVLVVVLVVLVIYLVS